MKQSIAWISESISESIKDDGRGVDPAERLRGNGGGGLKLSQQWGWNVQLEKWAQDEGKRKELFEWALNRAEMAAKVPTPEESVKGAIRKSVKGTIQGQK